MAQIKTDGDLAALNQLSGVYTVNKFGRNANIDTATDPADVWEGGGLYPYPSAAQIIQIASASTNDDGDPAGTGAQTIVISGLDENWDAVSETVTMDGTTTVETTATFIRVFRAAVVTAGSGGTNDGLITCTYKVGVTTAAVITAGSGQTLMALYTIPAGYTGLLKSMYATINSSLNNAAGSRATISLRFRQNADTATASLQIKHTESVVIDGTSKLVHNWMPPVRVSEKTDILIRVDLVSDNDSDISAGFDMMVIDNNTIDGWY